ncbi:MAG TPA: AAA family ATPase, partial [Gaiellaceae bacterium]|nr:AAA family ATPase [Gaiellaceae bacterium]
MAARYQLGEPGAALAIYAHLREQLAEELGVDPGPETEDLYEAILLDKPLPEAVTPSPAVPARDGTRFVGRTGDLERLRRSWTEAVAGRARLVVLTGPAGIGKTALARRGADEAAATGALVLQARCHEAERSLWLQPIADLVRDAIARCPPAVLADATAHAAQLVELVPELQPFALAAPPLTEGPAELQRRHTVQAVTAFLTTLARQQPTVVVIDDLHHAGAATVEAVHHLLRRSRPERLLILGTARRDEGREHLDLLGTLAELIEVGPLDAAAVTVLAEAMGAAHLGESVYAKTRGHALYVVEALRAATERSGDLDRGVVPDTLQAAVLNHVRRCGPQVETLLRAGTVLGSSFTAAACAQLLEASLDQVLQRAQRALEAGLLTSSGASFEFSNDLIAEVLYDTTPAAVRAARHARAAQLPGTRPEQAARHASAAGEWHSAVDRYRDAARQAALRAAHRDAVALLQQAVTAAGHLDDLETEARVRVELGRQQEMSGQYRDAIANHSLALDVAERLGDQTLIAEARERRGWAIYYSRELQIGGDAAKHWLRAAEEAAHAPGAKATALVLLGHARHATGDIDGARAAVEQALHQGDDNETRGLALHGIGQVLEFADDFAEARRVLDEAADVCRVAGAYRSMITSYFHGALAAANLGDLPGAAVRLDRLERALGEVDDPAYQARLATSRSLLCRELGESERALDLAIQATELLAHDPASHPGAHANLGLAETYLMS